MEVRRDEGATFIGAHQLAGSWTNQRVGVKEEFLRTESEIVNRSQQRAVIKDARAGANNGLALLERIVSHRQARAKIISVADDAFVFPAQAVAQGQVRP